jgi:hypothetical protein
MSNEIPRIHVTLSTADQRTVFVGKFVKRKEAFREAKRAAGIPNTYLIAGTDHGYSGPNGMAWIVE